MNMHPAPESETKNTSRTHTLAILSLIPAHMRSYVHSPLDLWSVCSLFLSKPFPSLPPSLFPSFWSAADRLSRAIMRQAKSSHYSVMKDKSRGKGSGKGEAGRPRRVSRFRFGKKGGGRRGTSRERFSMEERGEERRGVEGSGLVFLCGQARRGEARGQRKK